MKRITFVIKAFFLFFLIVFSALKGESQHRLVLLNPTVSNIESMVWMIENKVIDIPGVELLGVYSAHEADDYSESEKYLVQHQPVNYHLQKVEGEILPEDIYRENSCTAVFRKLFEESDAILFFGGPDIPAVVYGEKQNLLTVVTDPNRHYFETSFFFHLIGGSKNRAFRPLLSDRPEYIVRGFCLGMQTMNVAAGGTLVQDIPTECYNKSTLEETSELPLNNQHRSSMAPLYPLENLFGGIFHQIRMTKGGYLEEISGKSENLFPQVLSAHHQAVGQKGAALDVIATSMDGKVVEGLMHSLYKNVVGVQFHPEPASLYQPETVFTTVPGKMFSPNQLLKESNSLSFHKLFWKDFSEKVLKSKRPEK